jgi:hypothetical protein
MGELLQGLDLREQIYAIAFILFWCGVILAIPALFIWSMIMVARDRDTDINDFR